MMRSFLMTLPVVLGLAACIEQAPMTPASEPGEADAGAQGVMSIEERLSDTRLDLTAQDGGSPPLVMQLRADGSSATATSGFVLTGKWQVEGNTLCQTDIRFGGMPSDDQTPQCVEVSIMGDRVTLVGEADDGSPETFTGTITAL